MPATPPSSTKPPRRRAEPWTRAGALRGLRALAAQLGQDAEALLARQKLPLAALDDPEVRLPYRGLCRLLEAGARDWACPDFGLRLAAVQHLSLLGAVGLAARLPARVGEALTALGDRLGAHSDAFTMALEVAGPRAVLSYRPACPEEPKTQLLAFAMAVTRNAVAFVSGQPDFAPQAVRLACPAPADAAVRRALARGLGASLRWGAPQTALQLDAALLDAPTAIQDTQYAPLIRDTLARLTAPPRPGTPDAPDAPDTVALVHQHIARLLPPGPCTQATVARALGLHPRALQRRLAAQGTHFSALLDAHRHALALTLLRQGTLPLAALARQLGYADQSVFNQAFRRWTGQSPGRLRRQALGPARAREAGAW
ncbi:AraC family transcriptional regulator [Ideonella oryzae]|uniref:AraC family transcriptional regulator n=1 Tax=Ideonella oryzae TaxID=2937441 RepID=A0ABT1BNM6_9BURK|nr:AraC family transcriptional regulator [Ideonella oryzae]MCO5977790.1 AraC family transcriptional regulator [Ideonella oryzae]